MPTTKTTRKQNLIRTLSLLHRANSYYFIRTPMLMPDCRYSLIYYRYIKINSSSLLLLPFRKSLFGAFGRMLVVGERTIRLPMPPTVTGGRTVVLNALRLLHERVLCLCYILGFRNFLIYSITCAISLSSPSCHIISSSNIVHLRRHCEYRIYNIMGKEQQSHTRTHTSLSLSHIL